MSSEKSPSAKPSPQDRGLFPKNTSFPWFVSQQIVSYLAKKDIAPFFTRADELCTTGHITDYKFTISKPDDAEGVFGPHLRSLVLHSFDHCFDFYLDGTKMKL